MFGSHPGNSERHVVWWTDKDGKAWAQACSAIAASHYGSAPFRPMWTISQGYAAHRVCPPNGGRVDPA